jgi:hypothetical protein
MLRGKQLLNSQYSSKAQPVSLHFCVQLHIIKNVNINVREWISDFLRLVISIRGSEIKGDDAGSEEPEIVFLSLRRTPIG